MKFLVTGGTGFLGSNLARRLIREGHQVVCLDNLTTSRKENIQDLLGHSGFEFVQADVREAFDFDVEGIFNLACPASPPLYQKDPIATFETSVFGTRNCLELAKKKNISLLHASTSEVYGDPVVHPQRENYWGNVNPIGVRACYDEGKRAAETLCCDYYRQLGTKVKIVRIFNTYGPGMGPNDGRVVSNFIMQALRGEPLTVYGEGNQTRSFCYVDDLIEGLIRMMNHRTAVGPINLGNPKEYRVIDIARIVLSLIPSDRGISFKSLPKDDPRQRQPDITLAKEILDWAPQVTFEEGVKRTISYFKELLDRSIVCEKN